MKSLQFSSARSIDTSPLAVHDGAVPEPPDDHILIRIQACAICRTDLHIIEGELPQKKSPLTPGHQIVGTVERAGANVTSLAVGERVGVPWLYRTCGKCSYCTSRRENLCEQASFTGYDVDGGYAEFVLAPEAYSYPLPASFSDEEAAPLLCAGIIGYRALRLSGLEPGGRLGLFGFGASAHIAIQIARSRNCDVYVFSRSERHRRLAEQLGAVWTGSADAPPPEKLDSAVSFAPSGDLVPKALRVLRKGGTLALAGIFMSPVPPLEYSLLYDERSIRSVANSTRQDAIEFLEAAGEIPVKTVIEVFPLEEANRALSLLKNGKIQGAGVLKIAP